MIWKTAVNIAYVITGIVLFIVLDDTLGRIFLVAGWILLFGILNMGLAKLSEKKDANGNVIHTYYVSFKNEKDREKAAGIMAKYGTTERKTSRYDTFHTTMNLTQARNTIKSSLKLSDQDFEIFTSGFMKKSR
ncbi:MAG: hypothetical protein ACI32N_07100 [Bulleidia sp.]